MTQPRTEARPVVSGVPVGMAIGQAVGQAQSVLTRLLADVLAETGTTRETHLALQRLSAHGDSIGRDEYVADLSDWLDCDLWTAAELADGMVAAGLLRLTDGTIRPADAGAQLRAQIGESIGELAAPLWAPLDPADVETTVRTLRDITVRARALPAATRSGAAGGRS